jgi:hypothetical protein
MSIENSGDSTPEIEVPAGKETGIGVPSEGATAPSKKAKTGVGKKGKPNGNGSAKPKSAKANALENEAVPPELIEAEPPPELPDSQPEGDFPTLEEAFVEADEPLPAKVTLPSLPTKTKPAKMEAIRVKSRDVDQTTGKLGPLILYMVRPPREILLKTDPEAFVIHPSLVKTLPLISDAEPRKHEIRLMVNSLGVYSLLEIDLESRWVGADSRQRFAEVAETKWIMVKNIGDRYAWEEADVDRDPEWPEQSLRELAHETYFTKAYIRNLDHPFIARIRKKSHR